MQCPDPPQIEIGQKDYQMQDEDDTIEDQIDDMIKDQGNISEELAKELTKAGIKPKLPACGNPKCSVSTGIHEGLTFGYGKLDDNGYWEHPCPICARNWDSKRNEEIAYFKELYKNHKCAGTGLPIKDLDKFLHEQHEWLFIEAWPFKDKNIKWADWPGVKLSTDGDAADLINKSRGG